MDRKKLKVMFSFLCLFFLYWSLSLPLPILWAAQVIGWMIFESISVRKRLVHPSNYPFAAKVTNNFSVIWAVATGLFIGIWRRNDIITPLPKNIWWPFLTTLSVGIFAVAISFYPQEFSTYTGRRSFAFTEAFHNNPVFFMGLMVSKTVCIYVFPRSIAFILYLLNGKK